VCILELLVLLFDATVLATRNGICPGFDFKMFLYQLTQTFPRRLNIGKTEAHCNPFSLFHRETIHLSGYGYLLSRIFGQVNRLLRIPYLCTCNFPLNS